MFRGLEAATCCEVRMPGRQTPAPHSTASPLGQHCSAAKLPCTTSSLTAASAADGWGLCCASEAVPLECATSARSGWAVGFSYAPHTVEVLALFSMCKQSLSKAFRRMCTDRSTLDTRVLTEGLPCWGGAGRGRYRTVREVGSTAVKLQSLIQLGRGRGSSIGDCPLLDRGVVGGRDQRMLVQPGQAADVV